MFNVWPSCFGQPAEVHKVTHSYAMFLGCESLSRQHVRHHQVVNMHPVHFSPGLTELEAYQTTPQVLLQRVEGGGGEEDYVVVTRVFDYQPYGTGFGSPQCRCNLPIVNR